MTGALAGSDTTNLGQLIGVLDDHRSRLNLVITALANFGITL
jgi:hypothetical protein